MLRIENELNENGARNATHKIDTHERIGNFYLVTRQYGNARRYLDQALRLSNQAATLAQAAKIHLLLFRWILPRDATRRHWATPTLQSPERFNLQRNQKQAGGQPAGPVRNQGKGAKHCPAHQ
jgi:hypothetical protein